VHAVGRHVERAGDHHLAGELAAPLDAVVEQHLAGTRFGIRVDGDGLLAQGAAGWALTWMDARVGGVPITQRAGKAVELNALWIAALATVARLREATGRDGSRLHALRAQAVAAFARRFVRPDGLGLFDVVDGPTGDDASIRPNQLLALSLPGGPGAPASTLAVCRRHLLTPLGLRSLAPTDPAYHGAHRGTPEERDTAYHEGTVWPWTIGPFVGAALALGEPVAGALDGLEAHVAEAGLGSVSETADGDAPHGPTGCPFQGWSVAELLRARRLARS
jgi:predicted glycogen debranching enzyme